MASGAIDAHSPAAGGRPATVIRHRLRDQMKRYGQAGEDIAAQ